MSLVPAREVFRLVPPVILWWIWVAFAVANIVDFAIQGASSARLAIVVSAILVTVTGLAYALALRPRVIAERTGLTIVNPFRDHHVPWAAIQGVDTGEWVRVHYAPGGSSASGSPSGAASSRCSAASKVVSCWALFVSARAKRKIARGAPRTQRVGLLRPSLPGVFAVGQGPGYGQDSRLPEEAKYLASLPVAKAIAVRLDTRARQERARAGQAGLQGPATGRWAWLPVAAVALPALALLIIILT